jgi:hypothetical protein
VLGVKSILKFVAIQIQPTNQHIVVLEQARIASHLDRLDRLPSIYPVILFHFFFNCRCGGVQVWIYSNASTV